MSKTDYLRESITRIFLDNPDAVIFRPRITGDTLFQGETREVEYIEDLQRLTPQDYRRLYQGMWETD